MNQPHLTIHTDGGARGNPGPAAIGVLIESEGQVIREISATIGSTTNNQAEYQAVHAALIAAQELGAKQIDVYCDSELIVKQLRGEFKVKNKELGPWVVKIHSLVNQIGQVQFHVVRREDNIRADELVNQALDADSQAA